MNANIAVEIPESVVTDIKRNGVFEFLKLLIRSMLIEEDMHNEDTKDLTREELDEIIQTVYDTHLVGSYANVDMDDLSMLIANGTFNSWVDEEYTNYLSGRRNYYEVTVEYTGKCTIYVKATDERSAENAIEDLSPSSFSDFVDIWDDDVYWNIYATSQSTESAWENAQNQLDAEEF